MRTRLSTHSEQSLKERCYCDVVPPSQICDPMLSVFMHHTYNFRYPLSAHLSAIRVYIDGGYFHLIHIALNNIFFSILHSRLSSNIRHNDWPNFLCLGPRSHVIHLVSRLETGCAGISHRGRRRLVVALVAAVAVTLQTIPGIEAYQRVCRVRLSVREDLPECLVNRHHSGRHFALVVFDPILDDLVHLSDVGFDRLQDLISHRANRRFLFVRGCRTHCSVVSSHPGLIFLFRWCP